jgi:O-acetyl-ADP-ribose deacetylase (regulator of RNase III)
MFDSTRGDLLKADAEALVNTVNCVGVMGKGVALQFKQAYPENFRVYEQACKKDLIKPGKVLVVPTMGLGNPRYIINFPTKVHWKGKSKLEYIESGLEDLARQIRAHGIQSIAIPPLGCGNGGLDWRDVEPLIRAAFERLPDVRALVFEPAGAPAVEEMAVATERPGLTRARALLIRLIKLYHQGGYRLRLLEVQKLAYFLQEAGEPLKLNYVKHSFGPYAENLNFVLQRLEGHYIRGYGDRTRGAEIRLEHGAAEEAEAFLTSSPEASERLDRVARLIEGFDTPFAMELLASVHWVMKRNPAVADDESAVVDLVHGWSQRKRDLFSSRQISIAWQRLREEEGWLPESRAAVDRAS